MEDIAKGNEGKNVNEQILVEKDGITTFIGDTVAVENTDLSNVPEPGIVSRIQVSSNQDLKEFLARPVQLRAGSITSASAQNAIIAAIAVPSEMIYTYDIVSTKVKGFAAFRATMIMTLLINANKFTLGRLRLVYMPGATINRTYPGNRLQSAVQWTALPGVDIDLASESMCTLRVPFVHPFNFYDLTTDSTTATDSGAFYLLVYSAIDNGGGNNPEYSIYSHFEDVELEIPAYKFQGGIQDRELKKNKAGIRGTTAVASTSGKIGDASHILAGAGIPFVSEIATSVGWFSDIVSGIASIFGWSKPVNESILTRVMNDPYWNLQNVNGESYTKKLVYAIDNKVVPLSGVSYTDVDETSLKAFIGKYAFTSSFTLSTADSPGSLKSSINVNPTTFNAGGAIGATGANYTYYTPLNFVARYFAFWRGSVKFRFKIVKSQFHTGRLAFVIFPSPTINNAGALPAFNATHYCMRHIIDLQDVNTHEVVVPYCSQRPYTPLNSNDGSTGNCILAVYVVNPLVAISSVTSSVSVLVEVCAGEDFEFIGTRNATVSGAACTPIPLITAATAFTSQMGVNKDTSKGPVSGSDIPVKTELSHASKFNSGELVVSLNTLIRMSSRLSSTTTSAVANIRFHPYNIHGIYYDGANLIKNEWLGDINSGISSCFAFSRGSTNFMITDPLNSNNYITAHAYPNGSPIASVSYGISDPLNSYGGPVGIYKTEFNGGANLTAPPYISSLVRCNRINGDLAGAINITSTPRDAFATSYAIFAVASGGNILPSSIYKSAGDDYQLLAFHGIPPMLYS